jgi:FkbM family methyltransferase
VTFTSYAQNFEDVMLWRALRHVEHGFYIDIGAYDPVIDSVSLAFHQRGWHGIHVEPMPRYAELLREQRPTDIIIQAAVGSGPPLLRFFETPGGGISTADPEIADAHRKRGTYVQEITVPCIALSDVFALCVTNEIHWLKIDVEGYERQVLLSWNAAAARPWIVVVESTFPLTQIETHEKWDAILAGYGYEFSYFDGLNRFYISESHLELRPAFLTPPNVFDDFALNGTASSSFHSLIKVRSEERITQTLAMAAIESQAQVSRAEQLARDLAQQAQAHAEKESILKAEASLIQARSEERLAQTLASAAIENQAQVSRADQLVRDLAQQEQAHAERERILKDELLSLHSQERSLLSRLSSREIAAYADTARVLEHLQTALIQSNSREQDLRATLIKEFSLIREQQARSLSDAEEQLRALTGRLSEAEASANAKATRLQHLEYELLTANRTVFELTQESAAAKAELADFRTTFALMKSQADATRNELCGVRAALADAIHTRDEVGRQLQNLEEYLADQSHKLTESVQREAANSARYVQIEAAGKAEVASLRNALRFSKAEAAGRESALFNALERTKQAMFDTSRRYEHKVAALEWMNKDARNILLSEERLVSKMVGNGESLEHPANSGAKIATPVHCDYRSIDNPPAECMTGEGDDMGPIQHVNQLFGLRDSAFVAAAYGVLLGRAPDQQGQEYYLSRLKAERDRAQIIYELATSNEAKGRRHDLPGLDSLIRSKRPRMVNVRNWIRRLVGIDNAAIRFEEMMVNFREECYERDRQSEDRLTTSLSTFSRALDRSIEQMNLRHEAMTAALTAITDRLEALRSNFASVQTVALRELPRAIDIELDADAGPEALIASLERQLGSSAQAHSLAKR